MNLVKKLMAVALLSTSLNVAYATEADDAGITVDASGNRATLVTLKPLKVAKISDATQPLNASEQDVANILAQVNKIAHDSGYDPVTEITSDVDLKAQGALGKVSLTNTQAKELEALDANEFANFFKQNVNPLTHPNAQDIIDARKRAKGFFNKAKYQAAKLDPSDANYIKPKANSVEEALVHSKQVLGTPAVLKNDNKNPVIAQRVHDTVNNKANKHLAKYATLKAERNTLKTENGDAATKLTDASVLVARHEQALINERAAHLQTKTDLENEIQGFNATLVAELKLDPTDIKASFAEFVRDYNDMDSKFVRMKKDLSLAQKALGGTSTPPAPVNTSAASAHALTLGAAQTLGSTAATVELPHLPNNRLHAAGNLFSAKGSGDGTSSNTTSSSQSTKRRG